MLMKGYKAVRRHAGRDPRRFLLQALGGLVLFIFLIQILYPSGFLLPNTKIETVELGGASKKAAIKKLDTAFANSNVEVFLNDSDSAFLKATPAELGITASNVARIDAIRYPWYLRIIPTSLFWAHFLNEKVDGLQYQRDMQKLEAYTQTTFGDTCSLDVRNATVEVKDKKLVPIEGFSGGECDFDELTPALQTVTPTVHGAKVSIAGEEVKPTVTTAQAAALAEHTSEVIKGGIDIADGRSNYKLSTDTLRSWLDFGIMDGKLAYSFSDSRSADYLAEKVAKKVEKPTGETVVTLRNFAETGREEGKSGVVFNRADMLNSIKTSLEKGDSAVAVEVTVVSPVVKFNRTFSPDDAALNALIKKFASSHPGTYGVSLRELSGERRSASYRSTVQYTTASTYKLFVAYSTLLRVESGKWKWTDSISGGRNLRTCFNDMIRLSDNECAVALLKKATGKSVGNEAHALGATNTSFKVTTNIKSTAEDESLLLGLLQSGQILEQQSSRDIWITALKGNVYEQWIPAGLKTATVADKVGFLDGLLHDAAIVYTTSGDTYVLTIMTDGSSWANIALLTKQIEALRSS